MIKTQWLILLVFIVIVVIAGLVYTPHKPTLYDRLGGVYGIAAVVDKFSDDVLESPIVGKGSENEYLKEWSNDKAKTRLAGLKFMRTLWLCDVAGGPYKYVPTKAGADRVGLENAHCNLHIKPAEFNEVARILDNTLKEFNISSAEKSEVLGAFSAHANEVTKGKCPFSK
jgi:hemoglobin